MDSLKTRAKETLKKAQNEKQNFWFSQIKKKENAVRRGEGGVEVG